MKFRQFTFDAFKKTRKKAPEFKANQGAENAFYSALRKVARASGNLVESHIFGTEIHNEKELMQTLEAYSKTIEPWAIRQSQKMLEAVKRKNKRAFTNQSQKIAQTLRQNLADQSVDVLARGLMDDHVKLIKSIPIDAGKRAQALSMEAVYNGSRASEIEKELLSTTSVTESRARTIARTETARANASITEVRAKNLGVRGYFWECTMDGAERHSHHKMHGKWVLYSEPPKLEDGTQGHAGTFPNCRCWQRVVFED